MKIKKIKKIKKGDVVKIIAGEFKGLTGEVLKILNKDQKIVVSGVNIINSLNSKRVKNKFFPIDRSNVSICNEGSDMLKNNKKEKK